LQDQDESARFIKLVSHFVSKITNPGLSSDQFKATHAEAESEAIWKE